MTAAAAAISQLEVPTSRLRTHVLESGPRDAPALVLVHGNVSSARFFAGTMAVLGQHYHCLAPDLRGFGRSGRLPADARRGIRDWSDDLRALLTEGGLASPGEPAHLLGWSLGGAVVLQYAIDHPGAVCSIVLESPISPYGFGGTRDVDGTPCSPDAAIPRTWSGRGSSPTWWPGSWRRPATAALPGRAPDPPLRAVTPTSGGFGSQLAGRRLAA